MIQIINFKTRKMGNCIKIECDFCNFYYYRWQLKTIHPCEGWGSVMKCTYCIQDDECDTKTNAFPETIPNKYFMK